LGIKSDGVESPCGDVELTFKGDEDDRDIAGYCVTEGPEHESLEEPLGEAMQMGELFLDLSLGWSQYSQFNQAVLSNKLAIAAEEASICEGRGSSNVRNRWEVEYIRDEQIKSDLNPVLSFRKYACGIERYRMSLEGA